METYERYKQAIDNWEFHGTEHYYRIAPGCAVCTDGVKWFADKFECYWLLTLVDAVRATLPEQVFIVADIHSFEVSDGHNEADIKFTDGNDNRVRQDVHIAMTDLPEGDYSLWIANYPGDHPASKVIYLSTEH